MIASKGGSWPSAPTCNRGNVSTWAGIHGGMQNSVENYVGWDFNDTSVLVRSIKIKQFDTQYCAKTLAVQWSDDGRCFYDAYFVNASANCPFNTTDVGGHAGVTTAPPHVEPAPAAPIPPPPDGKGGTEDKTLNITFTLGGPLSATATAGVARIIMGTVQMTKGQSVLHEGMAAADGNAAGMCEYTGTLSLASVPDDGVAHDLFVNFEAGGNSTYLLDSFWLRAPHV